MIPFLLAALPVVAGQAAPAPATVQRDVVVTGRSLDVLRRELAECLARHCAPKEDIGRTLALAEEQFVAGDYEGSRATLLASRGRNKRYAASLPVEVSDLNRANSRLAGLTGAFDAERVDTVDIVDALKAGLTRDDARIMLARLEVGNVLARTGRLSGALERYRIVAGQARKAGLPAVEGLAMFYRAVLLSAVASTVPAYGSSARRAMRDVEQTTDPAMAPFRNGVRLIALKLMSRKDQASAAARMLAGMEPVETATPLLAYSPPVDVERLTPEARDGLSDAQWADVRFVVTADGTVRDVETLRTSGRLNERWLAAAIRSLAQRRYMPARLPAGRDGFTRVERFSFVNAITPAKESRIPVRSSAVRVEITDLTIDPAPKNAGS